MTDAHRDFSSFYDTELDGSSDNVTGFFGVRWRKNKQGDGEELVAKFRNSNLYTPDGAEQPQEIVFKNISARRDLSGHLVYGFYLHSEAKTPATRAAYAGYLLSFFQCLDSIDPGNVIIDIGQLDTSLVNRYVAWLDSAVTTSVGPSHSPRPLTKSDKRKKYQQLRYAFTALRRSNEFRQKVAQRCEFRRNPWPQARGMGVHAGGGSTKRILTDEHLRAIQEACWVDSQEIMGKFEKGERLVAAEVDDSPLLLGVPNVHTLEGCLATIVRDYGGIPPQLQWLMLENPSLAAAIKKLGGRQEIATYLVASPRTLVPFAVMLAMRTFFNTDPLLTIRDSFCRESHWLFGGLSWEIVSGDLSDDGKLELAQLVGSGATPSSAARVVMSSYKNRKGDAVSRSFRLSTEWDSPPQVVTNIRRLTSRLRINAPDVWADRLFLFLVAGSSRNNERPRSYASNRGAGQDMLWRANLKLFIRQYGLPPFTLESFRLTGADIVWEATNGDASAVSSLLGNDARTASRHYDTPWNVKRSEHRIAVMTNRRVRMIETKGRARLEYTACTPGFHCIDPYNSPICGQRDGHLCTAYPECPSCPLATVNRANVEDVAWLLKLEAALMAGESSVAPGRYQSFYRPILAALQEKWLPPIRLEVVRRAKVLVPHLPDVPELE